MTFPVVFNLFMVLLNLMCYAVLGPAIFLVFGAIHLFLAAVRYNLDE